ncbi:MAG: PAS domain S-box protein [Bacteroidales bacterium]
MMSLTIPLFVILKSTNLIIQIIIGLVTVVVLITIYFLQYRKLLRRFSRKKYSETFKEKQLLEQLFNNMPDRIYFKDRDSKFILANKFVSLIMGEKDPGKLIGNTDFDFYKKEYAQAYFDDEQRIMNEGLPMISKEEKGLNLDGTEIFVSTTKIPIRDKHNKVIGIIGIGRDITTQKETEEKLKNYSENLNETNVLLEERQEEIQQMAEELNAQTEHLTKVNEELERLSLVASKTDNAVVIMDGNGNFEWVNQGFETRYGMDLETFRNEYGANLRENSSHENISALLNQIYITKKSYTYNSKFRNKKGGESWSQTNISPIQNEKKEIASLILIDTDITELKKAEEQIKKQNREIEHQSKELKKINTTKDRLFSIIAHDLKNPFHSILGFTDILQKDYKDVDREKLNEFLEMISLSAKSAYQLLENLLDWAQTQTDMVKFAPTKFNLKEQVESIISLQQLQASNKKITLNNLINEDIYAYADKNMINTVIRNLASNAIKYTMEKGTVTFSASLDKSSVLLDITDTGIGIPEERYKNLFQLDRMSSTAGTSGETGTGLGLIICHDFMVKNNGNIDVSSQPGKGSIFKLTIPSGDAVKADK